MQVGSASVFAECLASIGIA